MKKLIVAAIIGCWMGMEAQAADQSALKNEKEKVSYSIGLSLGRNWKNRDIEVDPELVLRGIKDVMDGKTPLLTEKEESQVLATYSAELRAKAEEKRKQLSEKNKKEGEAFFEKNKTAPGVVTLPSGLEYKVLTEGKGESPTTNDIVVVNYKGTLLDGTEFDNSYKRGQPATNSVRGYIRGWIEALPKMKVGSKWELFIPPQLAYGEFGHGRQIGPNSTLVFEVELLGVQHPAPQVTKPTAANEPITSDIIKVPSAEELKKGAKIEVIKKEDLEKLQKEQQQKEQQKQPK